MYSIHKAIIKKENKYLILLRSPTAKYFPEHWDFSGGQLKPNETNFSCVEREVFEETTLKVKALKVIKFFELDIDNIGEKTHQFSIYSTKVISGKIHLNLEHTAFKWATKEEILKLKIEPFLRYFFNEQ